MNNEKQPLHDSVEKKAAYSCTNCGYEMHQTESKIAGMVQSLLSIGHPFFIAMPMRFILTSTCPKCEHFSMVRPDTRFGKYVIEQERHKRADTVGFERYKQRRKMMKSIFAYSLLGIGLILAVIIIMQEM